MLGINLGDLRKQMQQTQVEMRHPSQSRRREICWFDWAVQSQMGMRPASQSQRENMCWLDWAAQTQMGMRHPSQSQREMCWFDWAAQTQRPQMLHVTALTNLHTAHELT